MHLRRRWKWWSIGSWIVCCASGCRPAAQDAPQPPAAPASVQQQHAHALQSVEQLIEQTPPTGTPAEASSGPPSPAELREQARVYKAELLVGNDQAEEALQELQAALQEFPRSTLVRAKMIGVYKRLNRPEDTLAVYQELAEVDPKNATEYHDSRSQILVQLGRFEEGLAEMNKAIEREPDISLDVGTFDPIDRYRARAAIYDHLGRAAEAEADRQRAKDMERRIWPDR